MTDTTDGFFTVTRVHRDDLQESFTLAEIARLTDADMEWIAARMHECFLASGDYWEWLEQFARAALSGKPTA